MGIVSFIVDAADRGLNAVAESQFAAVASGLGTAVMLASTLAIIILFCNMALQIRPMDGVEVIPLLIKIGLINALAFDWVNFNYVSGLIFDGLDNIAGMLIGSITGDAGSGSDYFATRFDQMIDDLSDYANAIGSNLNWMAGAIMAVLMTILLSILGAAAALVLVLAKMVVTLLIGIAPVMILMSMFRVTDDYFKRWLSALISWSLYPIVIAGVFSVIFGLMRVTQAEIGTPDSATTIGAAIPFLMMILLSLALIYFIPPLVRTLSGDINAGLVGSMAGGIARNLIPGGRVQASRQHLRIADPRERAELMGSAQGGTRSGRPEGTRISPEPDLRSYESGAGAKIQRMHERAKRLGTVGKKTSLID